MESVIRTALAEILENLGINTEEFGVEHPTDLSHGDYASNVAMVAAKEGGSNPRELANQIADKIEGQVEYVEKVEVAGPGFINFYLSRDFYTRETVRALEKGEDWGKSDSLSDEEILIEYTSPNLFKPLHVGNLVGNIVGESLSRLFEAAGANVHRLNYPSDIGLTVAKGVWGLKQTGGNPNNIDDIGEAYVAGNAAYEAGGEEAEAIKAINESLYAGNDQELNDLREGGIATSKKHLQELLALLGTKFDKEIYESEASPVGAEIVEKNRDSVFTESEGALVYEGEKVGLHTRVFVGSHGLPTYEAKDLGNFLLKQEAYPNWTKSVVVTGSEQTEYFKVIFAAMNEIWPETKQKHLEHIANGFLTLTTGKMSSRQGNVLTGEVILAELQAEAKKRAAETRTEDVDELAEEIAVGALKYQILKQRLGTNIVFDKNQALSFEGDSGPYLQYTGARITSVVEKASAVGIQPSFSHIPIEPFSVEKILYRFPEVIDDALYSREPHQVVGFLTELAGAFNTLYGQEKIADPADEFAPYKLLLTQAVGQTLKNGLWVLGIKAPVQM